MQLILIPMRKIYIENAHPKNPPAYINLSKVVEIND